MAHNINFNEHTGKNSFFSVKQKAWHNLGQIVQDAPTSKEAIILAGLDYEIQKTPLFTQGSTLVETPDGGFSVGDGVVSIDTHFATLRTDNNAILGIVGKDYEILQNIEAFEFFDSLVNNETGITYETAGALGNGERVFVTAKLPTNIRIQGTDDIIENYLVLTTTHDGSGSITAGFTPVRVVCQNTLNASLKSMSNIVRIRHTSGAKDRLNDTKKVFKLALSLSNNLDTIYNNWAKTKISDKQVEKLIRLALSPNKEVTEAIFSDDLKMQNNIFTANFINQTDKAIDYAFSHPTQQLESVKGTLFGAYNAVSGYYQNVYDFKDEQTKFQSIAMNGSAQSRQQKAFDIAMNFANNGGIL